MKSKEKNLASLLGIEKDENQESLLGNFCKEMNNPVDDKETLLDINKNIDEMAKSLSEEELNKINDVEHRKAFFLDPVNQANILLSNYLMSHQNLYLSGKQKRNLYREFLRNAKNGMYKKLFNEQIFGVSKEESEKAAKQFSKLN